MKFFVSNPLRHLRCCQALARISSPSIEPGHHLRYRMLAATNHQTIRTSQASIPSLVNIRCFSDSANKSTISSDPLKSTETAANDLLAASDNEFIGQELISKLRSVRSHIYRSIIDEFMNKLFSDSKHANLVEKLAKDSKAWCHLTEKVTEKINVDNKAVSLELLLAESLAKISGGQRNLSKRMLELIDSLMRHVQEKSPNEKLKLKFVLSRSHIICDVIKNSIDESGKFLSDLIETDAEIRRHIELLEASIESMNEYFSQLDYIPETISDALYRAYSLSKSNWTASYDWLLQKLDPSKETFYGSLSGFFLHSIDATMNFNEPAKFERLFRELFDYEYNCDLSSNFFKQDSEIRNTQAASLYRVFDRFIDLYWNSDQLETLFRVWAHTKYVPSKDLLKKLDSALKKGVKTHGLVLAKVNIRFEGRCVETRDQLSQQTFKKFELEKMAEEYKQKLFLQNEVNKILNTEPLKKFDDVLNKNQYDVIIDGMNATLRTKSVVPSFNRLGNHIARMQRIGYENILIIFKAGYTRKYSEYIKKLDEIPGVDLFIVDSVIPDDHYVIYGALRSGPNAKIFTNDLLANNIYKLSYKYYDWLRSVRIECDLEDGRVIAFPPKYSPFVQKVNETWYIPYLTNRMDLEKKWVCVYRQDPSFSNRK